MSECFDRLLGALAGRRTRIMPGADSSRNWGLGKEEKLMPVRKFEGSAVTGPLSDKKHLLQKQDLDLYGRATKKENIN